ncbi:uncharacterized protein [Dermacentor albipictus]|uniref:uncharacterized protein isoform X2 n=1 Tax=Dermacentor albipictus TaxID=60249 RepID=UPI0038FC6471
MQSPPAMDYINSLVMGAQHRDGGLALPSLLLVPSLGELVSQFKQDVHYVLAADDGRRPSREDDEALGGRRDAKADPQQLLVAGDAVKVSGLDFLGAQEDSGEWPSPRRGARALSTALCPPGVQFIKVEAYEDHSLNLDGFASESPLLHENSKDVALSTINQDPSMLLEDLTKHSTAFEEAADMTDLFVTPLGEQNAPNSLVAQPDGKENKKLKSRRPASPPAKEDKCCSAPDEPEPSRDKPEPQAMLEGKLKITASNQLAHSLNLDVLPVDSVILGNFLLVPDAMSPVKFQLSSRRLSQILHEDGTTIKEVSINAICKLEGTNPTNKDNSGAGESPGSLKKTPESPPKNSRPFQCEMCSATFNRLGNYTRHQKIHTVRTKEDERFHCKECGKSFIQRCDLTRHLHVHTGTEPHRCSLCGKGYIRHSDLVTHQRFHNKEKPFGCPHCSKGFSQRGDLNRHLRSIHLQVKPLMCGHCHKKFAKEATLIRHMRTSHREMLLQSVLKA